MAKFILNGGRFINPKWRPCRYLRNYKHCFFLQTPYVVTFLKYI